MTKEQIGMGTINPDSTSRPVWNKLSDPTDRVTMWDKRTTIGIPGLGNKERISAIGFPINSGLVNGEGWRNGEKSGDKAAYPICDPVVTVKSIGSKKEDWDVFFNSR